jgi:hypothetical protein
MYDMPNHQRLLTSANMLAIVGNGSERGSFRQREGLCRFSDRTGQVQGDLLMHDVPNRMTTVFLHVETVFDGAVLTEGSDRGDAAVMPAGPEWSVPVPSGLQSREG